jgi:hypothetical protein
MISITYAYADGRSVITPIFQVFQFPNRNIQTSHIKLSANAMHSEKMTVERFIKPVARFRPYNPMFQLFIVSEFKRIESYR